MGEGLELTIRLSFYFHHQRSMDTMKSNLCHPWGVPHNMSSFEGEFYFFNSAIRTRKY